MKTTKYSLIIYLSDFIFLNYILWFIIKKIKVIEKLIKYIFIYFIDIIIVLFIHLYNVDNVIMLTKNPYIFKPIFICFVSWVRHINNQIYNNNKL